MKQPEKVDVVIVGSGAAGSVYAAIFAEAGKSVLVLEKGPDRKLTDLYSSQIWARRLKWGAPHVYEEGKDSIWYNFNAGHGFGGLGNSSGTLGRYLMSHPAVNVFGMFSEETRCYYGVTGGQLFSQDGFEKEKGADIFGSRQWEIGLGTKPNDLLGIAMSRADLFGDDLHEFVKRGSRHLGAMVGVCECLPHATNRIELSGSRDSFGMRLARVNFNLDDHARKLWRQTADLGVEIFRAAGATEAWHSPPGGQHIMGGTIMGRDSIFQYEMSLKGGRDSNMK